MEKEKRQPEGWRSMENRHWELYALNDNSQGLYLKNSFAKPCEHKLLKSASVFTKSFANSNSLM